MTKNEILTFTVEFDTRNERMRYIKNLEFFSRTKYGIKFSQNVKFGPFWPYLGIRPTGVVWENVKKVDFTKQ